MTWVQVWRFTRRWLNNLISHVLSSYDSTSSHRLRLLGFFSGESGVSNSLFVHVELLRAATSLRARHRTGAFIPSLNILPFSGHIFTRLKADLDLPRATTEHTRNNGIQEKEGSSEQ